MREDTHLGINFYIDTNQGNVTTAFIKLIIVQQNLKKADFLFGFLHSSC